MTDRPLPPEAPSASAPEPTPASGPLAPEAAPSRQRRPWTFLGRIARALREQNWAAVAVELVIVVVGIVIGFQVTAWGQQRANRTQELAYLRQLAADLAETERLADQSTADNASGDRALTRLIQASYARRLAPRDSVLRWFRRSTALSEAVPVLGTAEALVTTGDLVLLRDDSLRSAVTAYVEASRRLLDQQGDLRALWFESHERMRRLDGVDFPTIVYETTAPDARDSTARHVLFSSVPPGPRVRGRAMTAEGLLRDRAVTAEVYTQLLAREFFYNNVQLIRRNAAALRERVEDELDR